MPHSVFITAADTNPLAPAVDTVLRGNEDHFARGVAALARVADSAPLYVCKSKGSAVGAPSLPNVRLEEFAGPHPSGTAGLHIHLLDPVDRAKQVWHIDYQDAVAVGKLFATGALPVDRVVALAGPAVLRPRLLRTRLGAATRRL